VVPNDRERFAKAVGEASDDASKLARWKRTGLPIASRQSATTSRRDRQDHGHAGCETSNTQPGCGVTFRYIVQSIATILPTRCSFRPPPPPRWSAQNRGWSHSIWSS